MITQTLTIGVISTILAGIYLATEPVTELPLGIDQALTLLIGSFKFLIDIIPYFGILYTVFILALFIELSLWLWHWFHTFIMLFKS